MRRLRLRVSLLAKESICTFVDFNYLKYQLLVESLTVFCLLFPAGRITNKTSQHWTVYQRTQWPWRLRSLPYAARGKAWLLCRCFFVLFFLGAMHRSLVVKSNMVAEWARQGWVSMVTVLGLNCNARLVQNIFFFLSPPFPYLLLLIRDRL